MRGATAASTSQWSNEEHDVCGIAGAFGGLSHTDSDAVAKAIIREIRYRGPDGDGVAKFPNGFLVHLRLAIIDTGEGGTQPKWTQDGRYCITFNGEIYNYRELRTQLMSEGHAFTTESDTEVLLKVWEVWGCEGLNRCIGMYAFAIFDAKLNVLHLARDAYGIKPLYVAETKRGVRFGSTYAALACFQDVSRRVNARAAFEFVRYGLLDRNNGTLVRGVRPVAPGSVETWDVSGDTARQLGTHTTTALQYQRRGEIPTFEAAAEELREAFLLSVKLHLRSDVPIGFALSGGIDSSAIVCAARMLEPDADLRTFTYAAEGGSVNESPWAQLVANHTSAKSRLVRLSGASVIDHLETGIRSHGSPTATMSSQAQLAVFKSAHEAGIKVMLDGQGADESFAGYTGYIGSAVAGYLRRGHYREAVQLYNSATRIPGASGRLVAGWMADHLLPPAFKHALRKLSGLDHLPDWVDKTWVEQTGGCAVKQLGPGIEKFGPDVLGERLAYDMTDLIVPVLLTYEDRNSMQYSIESRVPFLAAPVTGVAYSVPSSYHLGTDGITKRLLRAALKGILPEEIRTRADKVGFEVPQGEWLYAERTRIDKILRSDAARAIKLFDHARILARWEAIDGPRHPDMKFVWRWLGLISWSDTFNIVWT